MQVIQKKLTELHKIEKNVRMHNEKQISEYVRSLKMFGQIRPLVIDEHGTILVGNGMLEALKKMGAETCDCYIAEGLTEKQKTKLMLADNRVYELGLTDMDVFDELIRDLGDDIDVPGWDEDLLQTLQSSVAEADELIESYGVFDQGDVERVNDRQRVDHTTISGPSAYSEPQQPPSAAIQTAGHISDSPVTQTATAAMETLSDKYIICPHCGERIMLPLEGGV